MSIFRRFSSLSRLAAVAALCVSTFVHAQEGSDHPLIGRYEGSELVKTKTFAYDEVRVIADKVATYQSQQKPGWLTLEGESTAYLYRLPEGRSTLEAFRNYEQALTAKGFSKVFACQTNDSSCYQNNDTDAYALGSVLGEAGTIIGNHSYVHLDFHQGTARYLLMKTPQPQGMFYAALAFAENADGRVHAMVRTVQTKEMDANRIVVVTMDAMKQALDAQGRISLYGITFDFDSARITPTSAQSLDEIEKLLSAYPDLNVEVVGHTDNQGAADYNRTLSKRRADAVVGSLVARGIDMGRLTPRGAGAGEPVADNTSEEGRAKNRRVELVKR